MCRKDKLRSSKHNKKGEKSRYRNKRKRIRERDKHKAFFFLYSNLKQVTGKTIVRKSMLVKYVWRVNLYLVNMDEY